MRISKKSGKTITKESTYQTACDSIKASIDILSAEAKKGEVTAKEAIANLSVVLLDLQ